MITEVGDKHPLIQHHGPVLIEKSSPKAPSAAAVIVIDTAKLRQNSFVKKIECFHNDKNNFQLITTSSCVFLFISYIINKYNFNTCRTYPYRYCTICENM